MFAVFGANLKSLLYVRFAACALLVPPLRPSCLWTSSVLPASEYVEPEYIEEDVEEPEQGVGTVGIEGGVLVKEKARHCVVRDRT
jgi:hypothetical protein